MKDSLKSDASVALEKMVSPEKLDNRLEIKFGDSSIIREKGEDGLTLKFGQNKDDSVKLKSTEDLKFLFDNSKNKSLLSFLKPTSYGYVDEHGSVKEMLNHNLVKLGENYRENPDIEKRGGYGGNPNAKNEFGSGQFNHEVSLQVLMSKEREDVKYAFDIYGKDIFKSDLDPDLKSRIVITIDPKTKEPVAGIRGMECNGTSLVNILKSSGLVRPDTSRVDFEKNFTSIHNQSSNINPIVPDTYNNALRFKSNALPEGSPILDRNSAIDIVKKMQGNDWAKITGMSNKTFSAVSVNPADLQSTLGKGYVIRASGYMNNDYPDHYKVITSSVEGEGNFIRVDDSLEPSRLGIPSQYNAKSFKNLWRLNAK